MRTLTRKQFLSFLGKATLAAAAVPLVASCGGDDGGGDGAGTPDGGGGGDCVANGTEVAITANQGHALTVPAADVEAGVERTYDITGSSAHSHAVTLTAAHFTMLQAGEAVTISSTSGGAHTHDVTVTCA